MAAATRSPSPGATLALPPPEERDAGGVSVLTALNLRRSQRSFDAAAPPLAQSTLASLLWAAQGVTQPPAGASERPKGRTCPSAGGLFPLEVFLINGADSIQGVDAGIWHYKSASHELQQQQLVSADMRAAVADACAQAWVGDAHAQVVICAVPERESKKYGSERGARYSLMEAGAAVENMLLLAAAMGVASAWVGAFDDSALSAALSLPRGLRPLAVIPIGHAPAAHAEGAQQESKARRIPVHG